MSDQFCIWSDIMSDYWQNYNCGNEYGAVKTLAVKNLGEFDEFSSTYSYALYGFSCLQDRCMKWRKGSVNHRICCSSHCLTDHLTVSLCWLCSLLFHLATVNRQRRVTLPNSSHILYATAYAEMGVLCLCAIKRHSTLWAHFPASMVIWHSPNHYTNSQLYVYVYITQLQGIWLI